MDPYSRSIKALESANCSYVIIGGFSVVMHGSNRFTPDLNIVIDFNEDNGNKVIKALEDAQFIPKNNEISALINSKEKREENWENEEFFLTLIDETTPNFRVEILLISPIEFIDLIKDSKKIELLESSANICSFNHLLEMKKILNRAQDNMDIQSLELAYKISTLSLDEQKEFIEASESTFEKEQKEALTDFAKDDHKERLNWLAAMLSHLGQFCMLG